MKRIKPNLSAVNGFVAKGINCGIKNKNKEDLGIILCKNGAIASGVFTKNHIKAAPVLYTKHIINNKINAVIVNSGNANACTGALGYENCLETARTVEKTFNLNEGTVLVCSTGVIGEQLPMDKIKSGIERLSAELLNEEDAESFSRAILTTDTVPKEISMQFALSEEIATISGTAKGSGMIAPNMATMLAFIVTDVNITKDLLDEALQEAVEESFNCISIDSDTSTNDTVLILANCEQEIRIEEKDNNYYNFLKALKEICLYLAKEIIRDGEGASKFIEINVSGAKSYREAKTIALSVANSPLCKTAFFGEDPNWGRFVMAVGKTDVPVEERKLSIKMGKHLLFDTGIVAEFEEEDVKSYMSKNEIELYIDLGVGTDKCTIYTTDLSYDYIKINADYRT